MDNERKILIVVVIEQKFNQLLGYYIQYLSLQSLNQNIEYRLCIIKKDMILISDFIQFFIEKGIKVNIEESNFKNPYFNKYIFFRSFDDLNKFDNILLLDWDIIYTGDKNIPKIPINFIGARTNPKYLYSDVIKDGFHSITLDRFIQKEISTSINSGVLLGNKIEFEKLIETIQDLIRNEIFILEIKNLWQQEQLVTSLAIEKVELFKLPNEWNSTPLTKGKCRNIQLWHYNDSHILTRKIKNNLSDTKVVNSSLQKLSLSNKTIIQKFMKYYQIAIKEYPFAMFIR